jgi:hypothetical protein
LAIFLILYYLLKIWRAIIYSRETAYGYRFFHETADILRENVIIDLLTPHTDYITTMMSLINEF